MCTKWKYCFFLLLLSLSLYMYVCVNIIFKISIPSYHAFASGVTVECWGRRGKKWRSDFKENICFIIIFIGCWILLFFSRTFEQFFDVTYGGTFFASNNSCTFFLFFITHLLSLRLLSVILLIQKRLTLLLVETSIMVWNKKFLNLILKMGLYKMLI